MVPQTVSQQIDRPRTHHDSIFPLTTDEIIITPVRELSYAEAKVEIANYVNSVDNRKVYISEIAEKLIIDFDLIEAVLDELENK